MTVQDFGDDGELYNGQVNRVARHILERPREDDHTAISTLLEHHNISPIFTRIESEKAAELALQHTTEIAPLHLQHISHDGFEHGESVAGPMAKANTVRQHSEVEGINCAQFHDETVKAIPRSGLKWGCDTTISSNQSTTETVASKPNRSSAGKSSWFRWKAMFRR